MDNTLSKVGRPHPSDGPHTNLDHLDWKALAVTWVKQQLENLVKRCGKNGMVQPRLEAQKKTKEGHDGGKPIQPRAGSATGCH